MHIILYLVPPQVHVLEQALTQHDRLISPEVRPLHDHLVGKWREMRESMLQKQQQQQQTIIISRQHPSTAAARRISRSASSRWEGGIRVQGGPSGRRPEFG